MRTHNQHHSKWGAVRMWVAMVTALLVQTSMAEQMWQLTIGFSEEGGLNLVSAKPISTEKNKPRNPNGQGGYYKIPVHIDWMDAGGKIISGTDTVLPLGIRMPASETSEAPGMMLPEQVFVLRIPGPKPGLSDKVCISRKTDLRKNAAVAAQVDSGPHLNEDYTFSLNQGFAPKFSPPPGPISSTKIRDTGPDGKRLVLVFLGDGYVQSEIDSGKYATDVENTFAAFASASPWDQMVKASNVYRVDVASNQSGADYENAPPGGGGIEKDTYFNTGFYALGIERLLTPSSTGQQRAIAAADNMVGAGVWDQIVIVVNSTKYGGAGGFLSTNSIHQSGPLISVHEVGHSLAGLADEYDGPEAVYSGQPVSEANVDTNGFSPKWSAWIDNPAPPLPTPDTSTYSNTVGAYEGARYFPAGIYRPWRSCRMRSLNSPFCPVCKEQHLKSFFAIVPLTDSVSPVASSTASVTSSQTFTVNSIPLDEISYEWFIGGVKVNGAVSSSLPLSTSLLPAPSQQLSVTTRYTSPMMRSGAPQNTFSWTVQNHGITPAGTPHWWLASNHLGVSAGEDQIDHDGDGLTTRAEYVAGTDPNDRESTLRFSIENITPSGGALQFSTIPGHRYRLECATKLDDWQPVSGYENIDGGVGTVTYNPPQSVATSRFYRIAVWIP